MRRINTNKDAVGLTMAIAVALALSNVAQAQTTPVGSALPRLVRFSGTAKDAGGNPVTGVTGITFALYAEQTGGAPLWSETQNVPAGPGGHYTVLLGAAKSEGLPADLFTAEQAHWVGVSVEGQAEQPRILLVSAPYALKAGDAETLGGLPPSAFLMAAAPSASGRAPESPNVSPAAASAVTPALGGTGTADYIPIWTDSSGDLGNSAMFQSGSGAKAKIGINTTAPATTLDVGGGGTIRGPLSLPAIGKATAAAGQNSQPLTLAASAFNNATSSAVAQTFQWQAEPVGNDTPSYSASLNLLFADGKSAPAETGLSIASNGQINFAAGQTYPGTGTITGVTAGSGLTGGGTAGTITVGLTNTCASGQVLEWSGSAWACAAVGIGTITEITAGTDLTGGGASGNVTLNLNTATTDARYARLGVSNSFSGVQSITASSSTETLTVTQTGTGTTGDGIHGITSATGGTGVFGEGAIAIQGYANTGGLAGLFRGATEVTGNGNNTVIGDPGCGFGYAGIGFINATLSNCTNYALIGGAAGDTYVNSGGTASIHFRNNNSELATIDNSGNVNVIGEHGGGNLTVAGTVTAGTVTAGGSLPATFNPPTVGVYGTVSGSSLVGEYGLGTAGVWGDTGGANYVGLMGTADSGLAGVFQNNSTQYPSLLVTNYAGGGSTIFAAYGYTASGFEDADCVISTTGDLSCTGTITGVVPAGAQKVSVYATQSTENWFEDAGGGQLVGGAAHIDLDPIFAQTVNTNVPYRVFLTPGGECKGLYVSQKSATSFDVRELGGGNSNIAFDYRIMAKRNGFENARLADVTKKYEEMERQQKELRERRSQRGTQLREPKK
jgi:hypothetical protein